MKRHLTYVILVCLVFPLHAQEPERQISGDQQIFGVEEVSFDQFLTDELDRVESSLVVSLYPVPVQNYLVIRLSCNYSLHNVRITVLDRQGYQVFGMRGEEMGPGTKRVVVPFEDLPRGTYYIWIQYEEGMITRQVIRQ